MGKEMINIKGTRKGLVILLDSNKDFDELKSNLKEKIASSKGFFKGAKFIFHLDKNILSIDKEKELEAICLEHGLIPSQEEINLAKKETGGNLVEERIPLSTMSPKEKVNEQQTLLLGNGLRSGQKINYQGNVTVLGDVNPGSEIVATGDIIVMGTLRGIAHAGALGNKKSIIVAYRLEATQLRIADRISRSPDENCIQLKEPEMAYIVGEQIEITKYIPNKINSFQN